MPSRSVVLAVASFLDSPAARALDLAPEDLRTVATALLVASHEGLGVEPRLLDGEHARAWLLDHLPGRFRRRDPLAEHVPAVLDALLAHLAETAVVAQPFELRLAVDASIDEFLGCVRRGENEPRAAGPTLPVVHRAGKLGRNDPCFCGSGKKFKKCHGRQGAGG